MICAVVVVDVASGQRLAVTRPMRVLIGRQSGFRLIGSSISMPEPRSHRGTCNRLDSWRYATKMVRL